MATNAEKMNRKYPPRRKVSARRDFPPQVITNSLLHGRKEVDRFVDSVMRNAASVEAVSRVKNNKDEEDENDEVTTDQRVAMCLERAEQERRELSLELERFEVVAREFGSLINSFATLLPPPEHGVAGIHEQADSHQVPVIASMKDCQKNSLPLPKLSSFRHCMPLCKTSGNKRKIPARSMEKLAQGGTADRVKRASNGRGANKKLEVRGVTSQKEIAAVKNGIQSPRQGIFESSKSSNRIPCQILDTSDFTSSRSLQPQPPISSSINGVGKDDSRIREKVQETLRLFQVVSRELSQENREESWISIGYKAREYVKLKNKLVNTGKPIIGPVLGVEIGDEFRCKMELNIIGLHRSVTGGIDTVKRDRKLLATSIVCSGRYEDNLHNNPNVLIYTGQGGNVLNSKKQPEDQKLGRGNLALVNSSGAKNPVRVIRGVSRLLDSSKTTSKMYVYDGLYLVEESWQEIGPRSKLVFKFRLRRIPGQPELSWRILKL